MKVGVCAGPAQAEFCAKAGADFIEPGVLSVVVPNINMVDGKIVPEATQKEWEANAAVLKKAPIRAEAYNCFIHGGLKSTGPERNLARLTEYAKIAFSRAAGMGGKVIVFGSAGSRSVPEGFPIEKARDQLVEFLKVLGPIAAGNGMTLALEHLNKGECNIVTSVAEGTELVRRAGVKGVGMLVDLYHVAKENESLESVRDAGSLVAHIHLAEPARRSNPGSDNYDYRPFFRVLKDIGYQGRLSIECGWGNFESQLADSIKYIRKHWQEA